MVIFLVIIVGLLIGVIVFQYQLRKSRSANLQYIHQNLQRMITEQTGEKLLIVTDDSEIRSVLIAINRLLEYTQKIMADYSKIELSRKKMISNVSHDLKTPLTVILGYIEMLHIDTQMRAEERMELLAKVYKKIQEVLELIHKFFDLTKLESGDQDIPITRINLCEICRQNILSFYDILTAKGFDVHIEIPEHPVFILGNEEAVNRVLNNLISNAIDHGGDGRVVGLILRTKTEFVDIEIWDQGKGIHEHHKDNVFERMFTLDDSRNKYNHNSGLGLTITKRLVEKMGGTITLLSHPHEKTIFSVQFKQIHY
ncbi:sensor histidine kinase [Brevibacillus formosus]|uniref:sensor histidine kinase n=1 Tax=Brevibacillus formosus TaxID=54913 RepID=UPI003F198143